MALLQDIPGPSELVIRCGEGFTVADACGHALAGPFPSIGVAIGIARQLAAGGAIWCENTDLRGRPIGSRVPIDNGGVKDAEV